MGWYDADSSILLCLLPVLSHCKAFELELRFACMCHALCCSCKGHVCVLHEEQTFIVQGFAKPIETDELSCRGASAASSRTITCWTLWRLPGFVVATCLGAGDESEASYHFFVLTHIVTGIRCNKLIGVMYWQACLPRKLAASVAMWYVLRQTVPASAIYGVCVVHPLSLNEHFRRESISKHVSHGFSMSPHAGTSVDKCMHIHVMARS